MKSIRSRYMRSKKAELTDMFIFLISLFILGVGLFVFMYIIPSISNGLKIAGLNNSVEGASAISSMESIGTTTINNGFLIVFVGLVISVLITSFLVRTHPIFLFMYILFLGITILLSFYLGNAYDQMTTNPVFASVYTSATFSNWILGHIAEICLAVGAISIVIVFAKFSTYGGTQQF